MFSRIYSMLLPYAKYHFLDNNSVALLSDYIDSYVILIK